MKTSGDMGKNRTGVRMSPKEAKAMEEAAANIHPPPGDESKIAEVRESYHARAIPVGSVPPPGSVKGMAKAAASAVTGKKASVLLDKMGERMAFERTGVRLYEALITKLASAGEVDSIGLTEEALRKIQDDELRHMQIVAEAIEEMGADPTAETPCADVAGVQAKGILQVLTDPRTTLAQGLSAILTAELVDNASWEMLVDLARDFGNDEAANAFEDARRQEEEHVRLVRGWLEALTRQESLGAPVHAPPPA